MANAALTCLIINRWDDEFAGYHRFVDTSQIRLCYITTKAGLPWLDRDNACAISVLDDLNYADVLGAATAMSEQHGQFDRIVGLSEYDLLTAARLREVFAVPGDRPEFVSRFKDKVVMKQAVAAASIRTPRFIAGRELVTPDEAASRLGFPMILKPRIGASSEGVRKISNLIELREALAAHEMAGFELEEYIAGDIFHVDGLVRANEACFMSVSAYVNTCLGFALGEPLGSVLLDPGPKKNAIVRFSVRCLAALGISDGVFHLELIEPAAGELVFLEVGLRCGGGEIPFIHQDLFSVNLPAESFRAALGVPPLLAQREVTDPAGGGFVMIPEPAPFPSRVIRRSSLIGQIPGLYREILPPVGEVFDGNGGYEHIGGRFHLAGAGEEAMRAAVRSIFDQYELAAESAA